MTLINQKLRSSRGATMIYALAALLIITVVSFLVISSATVNVGRVQKSQQEQQAYLNVSSAANLVKKAVEEENVIVEVVVTDDGSKSVNAFQLEDVDETGILRYSSTEKNPKTEKAYNPFKELLCSWVKDMVEYSSTGSIDLILTNARNNGTEPILKGVYHFTQNVDGKVSYVKATLKLKLPVEMESYKVEKLADSDEPRDVFNLDIILEDADSSFAPSGQYAMTVSFEGRPDWDSIEWPYYKTVIDPETGDPMSELAMVKEDIFSLTWYNGQIRKGGAD